MWSCGWLAMNLRHTGDHIQDHTASQHRWPWSIWVQFILQKIKKYFHFYTVFKFNLVKQIRLFSFLKVYTVLSYLYSENWYFSMKVDIVTYFIMWALPQCWPYNICSDHNYREVNPYCSRDKRIFPLASVSRLALGPTQPPVQWVPGVLSQGLKSSWGVTLTTHTHLVPRSIMSRSYTSSPPSASVACRGIALP
jgi:hypothetical protein